jgi:hypothetical protein
MAYKGLSFWGIELPQIILHMFYIEDNYASYYSNENFYDDSGE